MQSITVHQIEYPSVLSDKIVLNHNKLKLVCFVNTASSMEMFVD